jgi:hypothetical protein
MYTALNQQLVAAAQQLQDTSADSYNQIKELSQRMRQNTGDVIEYLRNAPLDEVYKKMMAYAEDVYASLKSIIASLYMDSKSATTTAARTTVNAVLKTMTAMEEKLVAFGKQMQPFVDAVRRFLDEISSGGNVEAAVRTLMGELFGEGLQLDTAVEKLCRSNVELCDMVEESAKVHQRLSKKYLDRIY